jgi:hypothetical protein
LNQTFDRAALPTDSSNCVHRSLAFRLGVGRSPARRLGCSRDLLATRNYTSYAGTQKMPLGKLPLSAMFGPAWGAQGHSEETREAPAYRLRTLSRKMRVREYAGSMKRDMDLVREILLALEASREFEVPADEVSAALAGVGQREIVWHLVLMGEAGLLATKVRPIPEVDDAVIESARITWSGYEFLAAASSDTIWSAAKRQAGDMFRSLTLGTLQTLLESEVKKVLL